jgi:hypothetical protein
VQWQLLHLSHLENISSNFSPTFLKYCTFIAATASARKTLGSSIAKNNIRMK